MPSWSIHLKIANKLNEVLKLDKDLFYYGNLIPDVDKCSVINRYQAHYNDNIPYPNCPKENMINLDKFLKDYKKNINNSLVLGYYCHLLTDNYYNNIVYTKCWVQDKDNNIVGIKFNNGKILKIDIEDKNKLKKKYKHYDFELYGKYLYNNEFLEVPHDAKKIYNNINVLKDNILNKELIEKRIYFLNNEFKNFNKLSIKERIFKDRYKLFSKEELDNILNDCVKYILSEIKNFDK